MTKFNDTFLVRWQTRAPWLLFISVFTLGVILSSLSAWYVSKQNQNDGQVQFDQIQVSILKEVEKRFTLPRYGLMGGRGVFATDATVKRMNFYHYVASRNLAQEFPGILGFGMIKHCDRSELPRFVAAEKADNDPDFAIKTSGDAEDCYIVCSIYPKAPNLPSWGYDIGSEGVRRAALESSVKTGQSIMTGPIFLLQDRTKTPGFLFLVPVYDESLPQKTPAERLAALRVVLYAAVITADLLNGLEQIGGDQVSIKIWDGDPTKGGTLLYSKKNESAPDSHYRSQVTLPIFGRELHLHCQSTVQMDGLFDKHVALLVATGGFLITALASIIIFMLGRSRQQVIEEAEAMTLTLRSEKLRIENLQLETNYLTERLSLALLAGDVGTWDYNLINQTISWDDRMYFLYGVKPEQFKGVYEAWQHCVHPEDKQRGDQEIEQALKGEKDFDTQFRVVWPDGSVRHIRARALITRDEAGHAVRMIGTNWDITPEMAIKAELATTVAELHKANILQ